MYEYIDHNHNNISFLFKTVSKYNSVDTSNIDFR